MSMRRTIVLAVALVVLGASGASASLCRGSFLGCRTRAQRIRYCKADCRTNRSLCSAVFERGRLVQRCRNLLVTACLGEGGTCTHTCSSSNPCPSGKQCVSGQCIFAVDRCAGGCPSQFPNCGPDGRCWTLPCAQLCGNDNCCGAGYPVCGDDGLCHRDPNGGNGPTSGGIPANLPPGNYTVSLCVSGYVSLPCQDVGTIPFEGASQFQSTLDSVISTWLAAATAGLPDCSRSATTYSAFDGSEFTASFSATCTADSVSVTESVSITVRRN
jgi:hypothetical protein